MRYIVPPWMKVVEQEFNKDTHEVAGPGTNPNIAKYHQATTLKATDDETPWCSAFANWAVQNCGLGYRGTQNAAALSWLNWGRSLDVGRYGSVAVFDHGGGKGHVTFFLYMDEDEVNGYFIGGNQDDQLKISKYALEDVADFRWPNSFPDQGGY